jgi:hypothetical protein
MQEEETCCAGQEALDGLVVGLGAFVESHQDDKGLCMSMHQVATKLETNHMCMHVWCLQERPCEHVVFSNIHYLARSLYVKQNFPRSLFVLDFQLDVMLDGSLYGAFSLMLCSMALCTGLSA